MNKFAVGYFCVLLLVAVSGQAQTDIWVNQATGTNTGTTTGSEADPFKSISFAMSLSASVEASEPWTIHVEPGTYDADTAKPISEQEVFPIELRQGMTLQGEGEVVDIVISGAFSQGIASSLIRGTDVTGLAFRSITFKDAAPASGVAGAAISLTNASGTLENCVFENNFALGESGGGLWLSVATGATFSISGSTFTRNSASASGGGFFVSGTMTGDVTNNTFEGNTTISSGNTDGGAGFMVSEELVGGVTNNTFKDNSTAGSNPDGAGFRVVALIGDVTDNTFIGNISDDNGGGFIVGTFNGDVTNNTFMGNSAMSDPGGGGFEVNSLSGNVANNIFEGNSAVGNSRAEGGGFLVFRSMNGSVTGNTFDGNSAGGDGGGFRVGEAITGNVRENTLSRNVAGDNGGGFSVGGALTGDVTENTFFGNSATGRGGGIWITSSFTGSMTMNSFSKNTTGSSSAAVRFGDTFSGTLSRNVFSGNTAGEGTGAIFFARDGGDASIAIVANNIFVENVFSQADVSKGATIGTDQNVTLINNLFVGASGHSTLWINDVADAAIIQNNIFFGGESAIFEPSDLSLTITDNDFFGVVNILNRNTQAFGTDLFSAELLVPGMENNHDWDPGLVGENVETGNWNAAAVFDSAANKTTLTDGSKTWTADEFSGALVDLGDGARFPILSNTASELVVAGDLEVTELALVSARYTIDDYHLSESSQNIDAGTATGLTSDFEGDIRPRGGGYDIGADEFGQDILVDLTVLIEGQGSVAVDPDAISFVSGTVITLTATPDPGQVFEAWIGEVADTTSATTTIAMNAEQTVTATFRAEIPELTVTPSEQTVIADATTTTFDVSNTGEGSIDWTAEVTSETEWLTISSGSSGTDTGTVSVSVAENTDVEERAGTIQISASAAPNSPVEVIVTQVGFETAVPPVASFTASPLTGVEPLTVQFADTSVAGSASITSWAWDFGDGSTDTEQNPAHEYLAGTYSVSLTVTTDDGSDTATETDLIVIEEGVIEGEGEGGLEGEGTVEGEDEGEVAPLGGFLRGDANLDGMIDDDDVEFVILNIGSLPVDSLSRLTADANRDGEVTSDDAFLIILYVRAGGIIESEPEGFSVESGGNQVTSFWDPVAHGNLEEYAIYRSFEGGEFVKVGTTSDTTFTDFDVVTAEYVYVVTAVDVFGNEGPDSVAKTVLANTIRVWIPEVWQEAGKIVRVPINFGSARGIQPKSMIFKVRFDPAVADFVDVEPTVLSEDIAFTSGLEEDGLIRILSVDTSANILDGEGRFFDVFLQIKEGAALACTTLVLEQAFLRDELDIEVNTQLESGTLCVGTEALLGDVDADGDVDTDDARLMLQLAARVVDADERQQIVGDINGDSRLDSADAVLIARLAAGEAINPGGSKSLKQGFEGGVRTLTIPSITAQQGETITLPVTLSSETGVSGVDLVFTWPTEDLQFNGATAAGLLAGFDISTSSGDGVARVSLSNIEGLSSSGGTQIAELSFTVTGELTEELNPPSFVRLNNAGLRGTFGESFLWFGDITRIDSEITIVAASTPEEGEGETVGSTEGEGEGTSLSLGCARPAGGLSRGLSSGKNAGADAALLVLLAGILSWRHRRRSSESRD